MLFGQFVLVPLFFLFCAELSQRALASVPIPAVPVGKRVFEENSDPMSMGITFLSYTQ